MSIENWPAMPPEITQDGPYRVYKDRKYAVYDDGNSAETPHQMDRADALEARLLDTAKALQQMLTAHCFHTRWCGIYSRENRRCTCAIDLSAEILAQLKEEGLT